MTQTLALVAVLGLAAYRATRLITRDSITDRVRYAISRWAYDENREDWRGPTRRKVAEFVVCPWCVGVWVSAGLYAWWDHLTGARFVVLILAVAGAQALLSSRPGA